MGNANPFDVWGKPPQIILDMLTRNQQRQLQRYVERTAKKVYRLAYDLGRAAGAGCKRLGGTCGCTSTDNCPIQNETDDLSSRSNQEQK